MAEVFSEQLTRTLELTCPPDVKADEVIQVVKNAEWDYEADLMMRISGKLIFVGKAERSTRSAHSSQWRVVATFEVGLEPLEDFDPDDYDSRSTQELISFSLLLPDGWDFQGDSLGDWTEYA
jgi:hypothetical protein